MDCCKTGRRVRERIQSAGLRISCYRILKPIKSHFLTFTRDASGNWARVRPVTAASRLRHLVASQRQNSFPEHHINVWMFSDGQPNHLYSTIFLFSF
jgi:hypothetical protein